MIYYNLKKTLNVTENDIFDYERKNFVKKFNIDVGCDGCFNISVDVYCDFFPSIEGFKNDNGLLLEPGEPPSLEIHSIEYKSKNIYNYINDVYSIIEEPLIEELSFELRQ